MKRKDFLKTTAILSLAPVISQAKVFENSPKTDISQKTALIGIGKRGAQMAINAFLAFSPQETNLYTIDENYRPNGGAFINIWYRKIHSQKPDRIPEKMLQGWEHNTEALQPVLSLKEQRIIITSAFGGESGTFISYMLISKILEHSQKKDITVVASFPFLFEGPRREKFSSIYLNKIEELGVKTEVIKLEALREKVNNLSIDLAFAYADRLMTERIGIAIKNSSSKKYVNV